MPDLIPAPIADALALAHPSWQPTLAAGLQEMMQADPAYLPALAADNYLPTEGRMFAAFAQPIDAVRYVLVGEGPYPRPLSATGICFMDGAVQSLWSEQGLSKQVNRATSLRNFMKMLLVAEGMLNVERTTGTALADIARQAQASDSTMIQTLPELQENLSGHGFLLLNAALAFRPHVPPLKEARAWRPFLQHVLMALADSSESLGRPLPTLVLWGKVAEVLHGMPISAKFPKVIAEHPYNLSFIGNSDMHEFFGPMQILHK